MAKKEVDFLVQVSGDLAYPIAIWIDDEVNQIHKIESVKGVLKVYLGSTLPLRVMIDPRYNVQEIADEIEEVLGE